MDERISQHLVQLITTAYDHEREIIIAGDWNATINPSIDRTTGRSVSPENTTLRTLLQNGLVDKFRTLYPSGGFTFTNSQSGSQHRIDMVLLSAAISTEVYNMNLISTNDTSFDHKGIEMTIQIDTQISTESTPSLLGQYTERIDIKQVSKAQWEKYNEIIDENWISFRESIENTQYIENKDNAKVWLNQAVQLLQEKIKEASNEFPKKKIYTFPQTNRPNKKSVKLIKKFIEIRKLARPMTSNRELTKLNQRIENFNEEIKEISPILLPIPNLSTNPKVFKNTIERRFKTIRKKLNSNYWHEKIEEINQNLEDLHLNFETNPGPILANFLDRKKERILLDKYVTYNANKEITSITSDPETVKDRIKQEYEQWMSSRNTNLYLDQYPQFRDEYEKQDHINGSIYDNLMEPTTKEELETVLSNMPVKAGGISGITLPLITKSLPIKEFLLEIINVSFKNSILPDDWMVGMILPIPKATVEWDSNVKNTRPITLLEIPEKITLSILTKRLATIIKENNVLKGNNFSVLPGYSTDNVLHLINSSMEYARSNNKECWIVLQDMKRAYDSVDPKALSMALRRLKIPEAYINLHEYINENRSLKVITAYGSTESFHPESGLPQGGVECPLHWLIFYDALLCYIQKNIPGFKMSYNPKNKYRQNQNVPEINISAAAFVDDTTWVASSHEEMQKLIDIAKPWYEMMGIEINPTKTKLLVINPSTDDPIIVSNSQVNRSPPNQGESLLGVFLAADGSQTTQKEVIMNYVKEVTSTLMQRTMSDQICIYIINHVLIPAIAYKTKLYIPSDKFLEDIDVQTRKVLRAKSKLPIAIKKEFIHQRSSQYITESHLSSYLNRLNETNISSKACMIREYELADILGYSTLIFESPRKHSVRKNFYCSYLHKLMVKTNTKYILPKPDKEELFGLDTAFKDKNIFHHYWESSFRKHGIYYLDQLLSTNGQQLLPFKVLIENGLVKTNPKYAPSWYKELIDTVCKGPNYKAFSHAQTIRDEFRPKWLVNPCHDQPIPENYPIRNSIVQNRRSSKVKQDILNGTDNPEILKLWKSKYWHLEYEFNRRSFYKEEMYDLNLAHCSLDLKVLHENTKLIAFTDGSVTDSHLPSASAGGSVFLTTEEHWNEYKDNLRTHNDIETLNIPRIELYGEIPGIKMSYKSEAMAIFILLKLLEQYPKFQITVHLDNSSVQQNVNDLVYSPKTLAKLFRWEAFPIWCSISKLLLQKTRQGGTLKALWVKSHVQKNPTPLNIGNNYADLLASKHGQNRDGYTNNFHIPTSNETGIFASPKYGNMNIESDFRSVLKNHHQTEFALESLNTHFHINNNNINENSQKYVDVQWNLTTKLLHNSVKPTSSYSSLKQTTRRSYNMKLFNGKLPTMDNLHIRNYQHYQDNTCKVCHAHIEDIDHIFKCPITTGKITAALRNAKMRLFKPFRDISNTPQSHHLFQICRTVFNSFPSFNSDNQTKEEIIQTLEIVLPDPRTANELYELCQNVQEKHFFRGLVPHLLIKVIDLLFQHALKSNTLNPVQTAILKTKIMYNQSSTMAYEYTKYLHDFGWESIWKPRCTISDQWAKDNRITRSQRNTFTPHPNPPTNPKTKPIPDDVKRKKAKKLMKDAYECKTPINYLLHSRSKLNWKTVKIPKPPLLALPPQPQTQRSILHDEKGAIVLH